MVPLTVEGSSVATILAFGDNLALNVVLLILLVILLLFSAFFSSSETAYSSVNIIRLKNYQDEKIKGAKKAVYIAEKFDVTLTTLLIGNNFVNIASTTIAAYILSETIVNPTIANILNTIVMTIIVLTFGEILPKSYAKENSEKIALRFSGMLFFIIKMLWPITFIFLQLKKHIFKKNSEQELKPYMTEDELESVIDVMEDQGVIDEEDAEWISSAININEKIVYDIMTPRVDMIAINIEDSIETIRDQFFDFQFSRMPVYKDDKDNIIGVLSERDFFTALIKNKGQNIKVIDLLSKPYFVAKSTKVPDLIRDMQALKKHFAIVSDEYGGTSGIVTLEDALEELVGEIYDEYDEIDNPELDELGDNKYLISAEMELEDLFERLNLGKVPESSYSNVGGYVYSLCEGLPTEGETVEVNTLYEKVDLENPLVIEYKLSFEIKEVVNRRIRTVLLTVTPIEHTNQKERD